MSQSVYSSMTDRLKNQHEAIEYIISGKSLEKLMRRPAPEKWSAHDNITHLAKYQPIFIERMTLILKSDEPVFERYEAKNDPLFEVWQKWETETLLSALNNDRKTLFNLITNMNEKELSKIGVHKKYGRLTLLNWTEFFLLHEAHHIFTVFQLVNDVAY